jgi:DnaJ-class molecular chaperone
MSIFIILIIVFIVGYYLSLRAHPYTKCRLCNGRGRHFGTVYTYAHRRCSKCGGTGRKDRLGVRLFVSRTGTGTGSGTGSGSRNRS